MPDPLPTFADTLGRRDGGGYEIYVWLGPDADRKRLRSLGGRRSWMPWPAAYVFTSKEGDEALAVLLTSLRDAGVAFLAGNYRDGYNLGGHYEALRDKGLVAGPYHRLQMSPTGWYVRPA